jgi:predicted HicB family RNase H-like nuclease
VSPICRSPELTQTDQDSGKILVRVPKTIHAALLAEAEQEGTSLNQLILSKLSLQLRAAV